MNEDKPKTNRFIAGQSYISLFFFAIMCILMLLQLGSRYIFARPLLWTEEFSRFCYVWIAFIGMGIAHHRQDHIKIDLFAVILPESVRKFLGKIVDVVTIVILAYLCYWGVEYLFFNEYSVAASIEFPMNYVYAALPIGCVFGIYNTVYRLFGNKK